VETGELMSFAASGISVVLALVAIGLSITFYVLSIAQARRAEETASQSAIDASLSSKEIASSVQKLDSLFTLMHADTFGLLRETVQRFPQISSSDDTEGEIKQQEELKKQRDAMVEDLAAKFYGIAKQQQITDVRVRDLTGEVKELLATALTKTDERRDEQIMEMLKDKILQATSNKMHATAPEAIRQKITSELGYVISRSALMQAIDQLQKEGKVAVLKSKQDKVIAISRID
jgi:hypothetical protein